MNCATGGFIIGFVVAVCMVAFAVLTVWLDTPSVEVDE